MKEIIKNVPHEWMENHLILLGVTGSKAYGTDTEDSDTDYKGICIPPVSYHLGLDSYNEYNTSGGKNFTNSKDDVDVSILHLNKFVLDAMKGVPNNIELLFLDESDYVYLNKWGEELIDKRHWLLSKQIMKKFGGYARGQMERLKKGQNGRKDLVEKYGYDTKMAMHTVRLLLSAINILNSGDFRTKFKDSERQLLLDIREGCWSLEESLETINRFEEILGEAYKNSALPDSPDMKKIDEWLVDLNWRFLSEKRGEIK